MQGESRTQMSRRPWEEAESKVSECIGTEGDGRTPLMSRVSLCRWGSQLGRVLSHGLISSKVVSGPLVATMPQRV
jgi:hypothetical protein